MRRSKIAVKKKSGAAVLPPRGRSIRRPTPQSGAWRARRYSSPIPNSPITNRTFQTFSKVRVTRICALSLTLSGSLRIPPGPRSRRFRVGRAEVAPTLFCLLLFPLFSSQKSLSASSDPTFWIQKSSLFHTFSSKNRSRNRLRLRTCKKSSSGPKQSTFRALSKRKIIKKS